MSFRSVLDQYKTPDYTWIECDLPNCRRIVSRFVTKGYWFSVYQVDGRRTIIMSSAIDLQKDIRDKLSGVEFELC